jgi:hypothetical protein
VLSFSLFCAINTHKRDESQTQKQTPHHFTWCAVALTPSATSVPNFERPPPLPPPAAASAGVRSDVERIPVSLTSCVIAPSWPKYQSGWFGVVGCCWWLVARAKQKTECGIS